MKLILIIFTLAVLTSCRTTKEITRTQYITDSTAIHERDSMIRVYRVDSAGWTNMIASLSENTVVFVDTGRVETVIQYYPDGSIKEVRGQVKQLTAKLNKEATQSAYWQAAYDSLSQVKSKDSVTVVTEVKTVDKYIKRSFPWWWFALAGVGSIVLWEYVIRKRWMLLKARMFV